jgi:hypothetical protein
MNLIPANSRSGHIEDTRYALKGLVNHNPCTVAKGGYITSGVDRLRKPMQKVADEFKEPFGLNAPEHTVDSSTNDQVPDHGPGENPEPLKSGASAPPPGSSRKLPRYLAVRDRNHEGR